MYFFIYLTLLEHFVNYIWFHIYIITYLLVPTKWFKISLILGQKMSTAKITVDN